MFYFCIDLQRSLQIRFDNRSLTRTNYINAEWLIILTNL